MRSLMITRSLMVARALKVAVALSVLSGCAWMMPADPYAQGQETPGLKTVEGLDPVYADPSLYVPTLDRKDAEMVEGGHRPPRHPDYKPAE